MAFLLITMSENIIAGDFDIIRIIEFKDTLRLDIFYIHVSFLVCICKEVILCKLLIYYLVPLYKY